jgi:hypothetical protein
MYLSVFFHQTQLIEGDVDEIQDTPDNQDTLDKKAPQV